MYASEPKNGVSPVIRTHAAVSHAQSKRHSHIPEGIHKTTGFESLKKTMRDSVSNNHGSSSAMTHAVSMQTQGSRCVPRQMYEGIQYDERPGLDTVEQHIIERAGGVILWAVLVFENLYTLALAKKTPPLIDELLSVVDLLPQEFDDVYGHVVEELTNSLSKTELEMAQSTLKWVNVANQHKGFTVGELWDALAVDEWVRCRPSSQTTHPIIVSREPWYEFQYFLRRLSGSLIEILPPTNKVALMEEQMGHPRLNKNWDSLKGTMRQLRGSRLKHILPIRDTALENEGSDDILEDSVIQLMHQTVKGFLTSSHRAGIFSVAEEKALADASQAATVFIRLALPADLGSKISISPEAKAP